MLHRFLKAALLASATLAVAVPAALGAVPNRETASASVVHTLTGVVGRNGAFKIQLADASDRMVKTLPTGVYRFVIHDDSAIHNFEMDGPHGLARTFTAVSFVGTKAFTLTLKAGAYKIYCAPHEPVMFQRFTVR